MPTEHPLGVCRTLLGDGLMRCSIAVKPGRQSCIKHTPAYDASYKRYKDAENAARDLRAAAQTKRGNVHTIPPEDIEPRIESVRAYIEALESEVRLRNEHDERFIGDPDEGHLKRLDALGKQLTHHRDIVEALGARLQRLKPVGQPTTPPKPRPHHRHTVSDPTPQPAPAPSVTRPSRRRSHGQPNQRRGGHGKSRSVGTSSSTIEGQKEHLIPSQEEEAVEEAPGSDRLVKHSVPSFQVLEDASAGDALGRDLEAEYSGGSATERVEDGGRREESAAAAAAQCKEERSINIANTGTPPALLIELGGSKAVLDKDDLESDGTSAARRPVPPSPLPRIVGEYPAADPEDEERRSEAEPGTSHQGRYLKYAFTAILPATAIVLIHMLATIRDRMPKR